MSKAIPPDTGSMHTTRQQGNEATHNDRQAYTLNIIDVFRLLNDCINNFYRESYPEDEDLSDSEDDDANEDIAEEEDEF